MEHLICQQCPNGCRLCLDWQTDAVVEISGNKCNQGIVWASRAIRQKSQAKIIARQTTPHFSKNTLSDIVRLWGRDLQAVHYYIPITGSPERSLFRVVIEADESNLFLLEQVSERALSIKKNIAQSLDFFKNRGLKYIQSYCKNSNRDYILKHKTGFWQMSPFVQGVSLDRETYLYEHWRGPALADFLIDLKTASVDIPFFDEKKSFSLKNYIEKLAAQTARHNPAYREEIDPIIRHLEKEWMPFCDQGPVCFCHGDYHPMNIIWQQAAIGAVIDWEFCGYKPEAYDMANLIGCLGVEHPSSLLGALVIAFLERIKSSGRFAKESLIFLPEFVLALRFAWLSEWLRRNDTEMIDLEIAYMHLLMDNQEKLRQAWDLPVR